jgi:hypothetical protein
MSITHNPKQILEQLQIILSSPSKKIGFLFGAGISMKYKKQKDLIPSSEKITNQVINDMKKVEKMSIAIESIKKEIITDDKKFHIETLLSKIAEKERAAGIEILCGLNKAELKKLRVAIEKEITDIVSVHNTTPKFQVEDTSHYEFARWIKNADRDFPIEIFTTNYDYLLELALEKNKISYFDGFVGSYEAFFCSDWIEDISEKSPVKDWTKLWKLHGSLGWDINNENEKEIIRSSSKKNNPAVIYPSSLKYDHSRKQPYLSYLDRLSGFIRQEDAVLFVCGYSFGDDHINEIITTALLRSRSSHVIVLKNSGLQEVATLAKIAKENSRISVYARPCAIIGGNLGDWQLDKKLDKNESVNIVEYGYDENAAEAENPWSGKGNFILGDFEKFTVFLSHFYNNSHYMKNTHEKN